MQKLRLTLISLIIFIHSNAKSQDKYVMEKAKVQFVSIAQLEIIKASTEKVVGIIDPKNNQFVFSVDNYSFNGFKSPHQREHFMENYLEVDIFPKSTFKGKIIEKIDFAVDTTYEVRAKGDLEIHGVTQNRIIKSKINIKNGKISVESKFIVPLIDHNIAIPRIVNQKIAEQIEVEIKAQFIYVK